MFKRFILIISLLAIFLFTVGYILVKAYPTFKTPYAQIKSDKPIEVTLEFWGLWDNSDNWKEIIKKFENETYDFDGHEVNVSINYTKKDFGSYEEDIKRSKENNNVPSIFMINNNWLGSYVDLLEPLTSNDAYIQEYDLISHQDLLDTFPTGTLIDAVYDDQLYGMPLYSDSLALYYNRDIFEKAEIEELPGLWKEFDKVVKKLTILNHKDEIVQAGTALGTGKNINRSSDILALLIMQGGGKVIDNEGEIDINKEIEVNVINGVEKRTPGKRGIEFYTGFANPRKEIYSWNSDQENYVKAFGNGKVAMIIGYNYNVKNLLAINPDLNYGISQMPQLENSTLVNLSNVTIPVVSNSNSCKVEPAEFSSEVDCAKISWSFLSSAIEKENSKQYLDLTDKAAARKDLIREQIRSGDKVGIFAKQAESSRSYNKFNDKIDNILVEMIDQINLDRGEMDEIINEAVLKIESLK